MKNCRSDGLPGCFSADEKLMRRAIFNQKGEGLTSSFLQHLGDARAGRPENKRSGCRIVSSSL
jgi:hypothetical protein